MFVAVIHRIHDREGFRAAQANATEALPDGVTMPVHATSRDHRLGIWLGEGESVTAVRGVVEAAVGPFADTEYYEIEVDGLVPQPQRGPGEAIPARHRPERKQS